MAEIKHLIVSETPGNGRNFGVNKEGIRIVTDAVAFLIFSDRMKVMGGKQKKH